jgi:homocysteine S-methyltransferase
VATRAPLPQLDGRTFITDGGMETTLIFRDGLELPDFASFVLLDDPEGLEALRGYYAAYVAIAKRHGVGIVLDTPTWRANLDWGARLGYSAEALDDVNRRGVALLTDMRAEGGDGVVIVISGCIGPRGDGYVVGEAMSPDEAQAYHSAQVSTFAGTDADLVSALTLNYADEATGIARAAVDAGIPSVISFTVETDGRLPSGQELRDAVAEVDAATGAGPAYYMVNCAHPTHFEDVLSAGGLERIRGLRANASTKSHAELDEAEELDQGDPDDLAARYRELRPLLPGLNVVGGCCGTDERHIETICAAFS